MKLLFLGNSADVRNDVPPEERRGTLLAREMERAFGEPVEIVTKTFWPNAQVPTRVEAWLEEERPDMLLITASAFPFAYPSVPLKLERMLGRLGKPVRRAGVGAANTPWLAHNPVFRGLRRAAQLTIGGAYYLSVDEVIENTTKALRVAVRHEQVIVVYKGPGGGGVYQPSAGARRLAEQRRQRVLDGIEQVCRELHVEFIRHDIPSHIRTPDVEDVGDGIHGRTDYHQVRAAELIPTMLAAWQRHHGIESAAVRQRF